MCNTSSSISIHKVNEVVAANARAAAACEAARDPATVARRPESRARECGGPLAAVRRAAVLPAHLPQPWLPFHARARPVGGPGRSAKPLNTIS